MKRYLKAIEDCLFKNIIVYSEEDSEIPRKLMEIDTTEGTIIKLPYLITVNNVTYKVIVATENTIDFNLLNEDMKSAIKENNDKIRYYILRLSKTANWNLIGIIYD